MKKINYVFLLFLLYSCSTGKVKNIEKITGVNKTTLKYASGFEIQTGKRTILSVKNPWQNASDVEFKYRFTDRSTGLTDSIDEYEQIITPVKKIVCLSTTHLGFVDFIGELGSIKGISGTQYVTNKFLRNEIDSGKIREVGYEENLNFEVIIDLDPDVVIAYGVSGSESGYMKKIKDAGIPVLYVAEYLEEDPLAKAEWVKVFALLYNRLEEITEKFDSVVTNYKVLKDSVSRVTNKPVVLLGLPWQGTWYVSGGKSYVARLLYDAGGDYLFSDYTYKDTKPVMLETIFSRSSLAEYWLNTGTANSIRDIINEDKRFAGLNPLKNGNVYNYNNLVNSAGGNAYFELGVVEPDIILADLIHILHPEVLPSHKLKYYKKLE